MSQRTFFASATSDGRVDFLMSDGTPGRTAVIAVPDAYANGVTPTNITVFGSKVVFTGLDGNRKSSLFVYDGATDRTGKVTGIGTNAAILTVGKPVAAGTKLLSKVTDASGNVSLFSYDTVSGVTVTLSTRASPGSNPWCPSGIIL